MKTIGKRYLMKLAKEHNAMQRTGDYGGFVSMAEVEARQSMIRDMLAVIGVPCTCDEDENGNWLIFVNGKAV